MTRILLTIAVCASLAAAGLFWLWQGERDERIEAQREAEAQETAKNALDFVLRKERQINADLQLSIQEIENAPVTNGCGPSVGIALDRLRAVDGDP